MALSENLRPTNDLVQAVADKDLVLVVVPSHVMRQVTTRMAGRIEPHAILVSASKGIENDTLLTMAGVIKEALDGVGDDRFAVLSGPSFAKEVAQGLPTVVTVASKALECAQKVQHVFATPNFRVYTHDDVVGVELGGSVKNVIAIAAGMVDGMGLGLNTRAALITRGMTEIRRLGLAMGAQHLVQDRTCVVDVDAAHQPLRSRSALILQSGRPLDPFSDLCRGAGGVGVE